MRPNLGLVPFDPEIERTISKLRAQSRKTKQSQAHASSHSSPLHSPSHTSPLAFNHTILDNHCIMAEHQPRNQEPIPNHNHHQEHQGDNEHDRNIHEDDRPPLPVLACLGFLLC